MNGRRPVSYPAYAYVAAWALIYAAAWIFAVVAIVEGAA